MSRDLSWSNHMDAIVNKANKVVGLIKRTVGSKNMEIFSMLYEVLCLTNPKIRMRGMPGILKLAVEKLQRRASRVALDQKLREMSYEERCMYC